MNQRENVLKAMADVDGIMSMSDFEPTDRMKALDEAMLSGRATLDEVLQFVKLHAVLAGANSVLEVLPQDDPMYGVIEDRSIDQRDALTRMAIKMDGAVRVAFGL